LSGWYAGGGGVGRKDHQDGAAHACQYAPCRARFLSLSLRSPSPNSCRSAGHTAHFQPTFLSVEGTSTSLSYRTFPGTCKVEQSTVCHARISLQTLWKISREQKSTQNILREMLTFASVQIPSGDFFYQECIMLNHCFLSKSK